VDRNCPECGGVLAELVAVDEYASARGRYSCSECQIMFEVDATNELREVDR
jgi:transcription elongation factor Elf1